MGRWSAITVLFAAGLAVTVAGFRVGGSALACEVSGGLFCTADPVAKELLYVGLALLSVALLTAVVTVARRA